MLMSVAALHVYYQYLLLLGASERAKSGEQSGAAVIQSVSQTSGIFIGLEWGPKGKSRRRHFFFYRCRITAELPRIGMKLRLRDSASLYTYLRIFACRLTLRRGKSLLATRPPVALPSLPDGSLASFRRDHPSMRRTCLELLEEPLYLWMDR